VADIQLVTDRLLLRRMALDDVASLHTILSDPEAMRYWSTLPHDSVDVTEAWVIDSIARVAAGEADEFVVVLSGAVIGKVGLWKGTEIGVILSRACWGQGYAAEALAASIDRAFGDGVSSIVADVDPGNAASLKLFNSLGFRQTGYEKATFLLGGVWSDSVYLGLTPQQWAEQKAVSRSTVPIR
jgi:RimJ/RimL family protein N-acetyltransferase